MKRVSAQWMVEHSAEIASGELNVFMIVPMNEYTNLREISSARGFLIEYAADDLENDGWREK